MDHLKDGVGEVETDATNCRYCKKDENEKSYQYDLDNTPVRSLLEGRSSLA